MVCIKWELESGEKGEKGKRGGKNVQWKTFNSTGRPSRSGTLKEEKIAGRLDNCE